jgi:hypothetical protein
VSLPDFVTGLRLDRGPHATRRRRELLLDGARTDALGAAFTHAARGYYACSR